MSALVMDQDRLDSWRRRLSEAVGPNGRLICDLAPEAALLFGELLPLPDLTALEAQNRSQTVLRQFIACFVEPSRPLVIFLDDLQWFDAATIGLMEQLTRADDLGPLLLIGAYRDNEINAAHPLRLPLDRLRDLDGRYEEITLDPLREGDIARLVAETLRRPITETRSLAATIHRKTDGNPFFAVQFLTALYESEQLRFDTTRSRWTWDEPAVLASGFTDNVVDLMIQRIARLDQKTSALLSSLACFGASISVDRLALLLQTDAAGIEDTLIEALRAGLVRRSDDGRYSFMHDRVQEAAYAILQPAERAEAHLRIGRLLLAQSHGAGLDEAVFDIVNQLNRAAELLVLHDERRRLAQLNFAAGQRARAASAFDAALGYFTTASELFGDDALADEDRQAFQATFYRAECEIFAKQIEAPDQRLAALAAHVANRTEDAMITCQRAVLYSSFGQDERSIDLGLACLERFGVRWPRHPEPALVGAAGARLRGLLQACPVEDLLQAPKITDPDQIAIMDVLAAMIVPTMFINPHLLALVVSHSIDLTLEFGNCDASAMAFAMSGMMFATMMDRHDRAGEIASLALALVEQRDFRRFRTRVFVIVGHVRGWTGGLDVLRDMGTRAMQAGIETGDATFASYGAGQPVTAALASGAPLVEIERLALQALAFINSDVDMMVPQILTQLNVARALMGEPAEFGIYGSEAAIDARFDRDGDRHAIIVQWTCLRRLERNVFLGDPAIAVLAADRMIAVIGYDTCCFEWAECQFYGALARAMSIDSGLAADREIEIEAMRRHVAHLDNWVTLHPATFAHRRALAKAELLRIEGQSWHAQSAYREAIAAARVNGFQHHEALAHERAAYFFQQEGFEDAARAHLQAARLNYLRWGAVAKVAALDAAAPGRLARAMQEGQSATADPTEKLDLATVLRVSASLTGEISLERLIRQLLLMVLEHGAAERAVLLALRHGAPKVEAEAHCDENGVVVSLVTEGEPSPAVPEAIVRYVARTHETLFLADETALAPFMGDPYLAAVKPRSLLALPLIKQGRLVGIVLLENRMTAGSFGPTRLSVLKLVAVQAATALENATLYAELNTALVEVNRSEQAARTMVNAIPVMICVSDAAGDTEYMSEDWTDYSGFVSDEMVGRGWMASLHPDDLEPMLEFNARCIASGEGGAIEARLQRRDGAFRWFWCHAKPLRDETGIIIKWYSTLIDIHETKVTQAALKSLEARLSHVSRIASLSELTASIAHEVNQPLAAVLTNAETGLRWLSAPTPNIGEATAVLERVRGNAKRMSEVIVRLRQLFVRGDEAVLDQMDLNEAITEMAAFVQPELARHRVDLTLDLDPRQPIIAGTRVEIQQVILNLMNNAIQAVVGLDRRSVAVRSRRAEQSVQVEVADTGIGLGGCDPEGLFTSFQTTKPGGMGLGLSISRTIIERHGGRIWGVPSAADGAAFRFELPSVRKG